MSLFEINKHNQLIPQFSIRASLRGTKQSFVDQLFTDCFVPRNDAPMVVIALITSVLFPVITALWLLKNSFPLPRTLVRKLLKNKPNNKRKH
jgi:hypothetical protein